MEKLCGSGAMGLGGNWSAAYKVFGSKCNQLFAFILAIVWPQGYFNLNFDRKF